MYRPSGEISTGYVRLAQTYLPGGGAAGRRGAGRGRAGFLLEEVQLFYSRKKNDIMKPIEANFRKMGRGFSAFMSNG